MHSATITSRIPSTTFAVLMNIITNLLWHIIMVWLTQRAQTTSALDWPEDKETQLQLQTGILSSLVLTSPMVNQIEPRVARALPRPPRPAGPRPMRSHGHHYASTALQCPGPVKPMVLPSLSVVVSVKESVENTYGSDDEAEGIAPSPSRTHMVTGKRLVSGFEDDSDDEEDVAHVRFASQLCTVHVYGSADEEEGIVPSPSRTHMVTGERLVSGFDDDRDNKEDVVHVRFASQLFTVHVYDSDDEEEVVVPSPSRIGEFIGKQLISGFEDDGDDDDLAVSPPPEPASGFVIMPLLSISEEEEADFMSQCASASVTARVGLDSASCAAKLPLPIIVEEDEDDTSAEGLANVWLDMLDTIPSLNSVSNWADCALGSDDSDSDAASDSADSFSSRGTTPSPDVSLCGNEDCDQRWGAPRAFSYAQDSYLTDGAIS